MKDEEKQLFKKLCNFQSENLDAAILEYATPAVLGHLFFNRMQAVAYETLKKYGLLGKINREFRSSLKNAWEQNLEKNRSFYLGIQYLNIVLAECAGKYAMLKGAVLCGSYPEGCRTSNDIDLLVLPENVTQVGNALLKAGFRQGNIRNGEFVPASRKEIIESKLTRGETVPYIKEVGMPGMRFLEVDINFSLDYKNGETDVLKQIMDRVCSRNILEQKIPTLDEQDFLIHLCAHLYKEATTLPWVEMKRDMTLYKFCDIYLLLSRMSQRQTEALFLRAQELGMEKICAFAVAVTKELFDVDNKAAIGMAEDVLQVDPEFIHTVISPKDKKILRYTQKDILNRFFADDRKALLKEVTKE